MHNEDLVIYAVSSVTATFLPRLNRRARHVAGIGKMRSAHFFPPTRLARCVGRDSVVGMATRYALDGPGIESRWVARFSALVLTVPGAHPISYTVGSGSFPGLKRSVRGVDHPSPISAEIKVRIELYIYCHSVPSWPLLG
jgi:hypothetical protein